MKIYVDCKEDPGGRERTIKEFYLDGKYHKLDECCAGGVDLYGEAKGCQNFVCRIGKRKFMIYCEEEFKDGRLEQRYFILKEE